MRISESSPFAADGLGIAGIIWDQTNDLNGDATNAQVAVQGINVNARETTENALKLIVRPDVVTAECVGVAAAAAATTTGWTSCEVGGGSGSDGRQSNNEEDKSVDEHEVCEASAQNSTKFAGSGESWYAEKVFMRFLHD